MHHTTALVLFSGGQDSTTCLAHALQAYERVETIAFDYRQRHHVELEARLKVLADKSGKSADDQLRQIIDLGLEDLEDYYLAVEVQERIRRGEEDVLTSEEAWRGLDD